MPKMKNCPVCDQPIKLENLEGHVKKVHPRAKVELEYTEKEETHLKEHEQRQKELTRPSGLWKAGAILVVIIVVAAAVTFLYPTQSNGGTGTMPTGQLAPDFSAVDTDGNSISLSDYLGKPVLLNFFDTDCDYCKAHTANVLVKISKDYKDRIMMISIDVGFIGPGDTVADINKYKMEYNSTWTYILDEIPADSSKGPLANLYGVSGTPTDFIVDSNGKIAYSNDKGTATAEDIAAILDSLLD
jgi:peroxiredoxin